MSFRSSRLASLLLCAVPFAVAAMSTSAEAATVKLSSFATSGTHTDMGFLNGTATSSAVKIDGVNSSVLLKTKNGVDSLEKSAPFFYAGDRNTAIGTLGDLSRGSFSVDWLLNSRGANTASYVGNIAAFRIIVEGPTVGSFVQLIWEAAYQSPNPTFSQGVAYDNVDIGSGKFWARSGTQNYGQGDNGPYNLLTLAQLASGTKLTTSSPAFSDLTKVYGVQVSIGSAAGDYSANVGDITMTFNSVAPVVPLPAAAWAGMALLGGVGLMRRRAAKNAVA